MASTVWRGYVSFGLISIPVRLFRAARAERISLRRLHRETDASPAVGTMSPQAFTPMRNDSEPRQSRAAQEAKREVAPEQGPPAVLTPVRQVSVQKETGDVVAAQSIVKGFEYEKNRFVALEPDELKDAAPTTSAAMEIQEFVQLVEIDPVYFETSYYVVPEEAGEKAYALLYRALQTSGLVALAQFAMHGREHVVVLRPGKSHDVLRFRGSGRRRVSSRRQGDR
jgi:DNA end-binding protein Ku